MTTETKQQAFQSWYERNKESMRQKRAEKYRNDPEYRQAALDRAAKQRASTPRTAAEKGQRFRVIDGKSVEVFRIGAVAEMIGKDEQTIRLWESRGVIPAPSAPGKHRYYTATQVSLLKGLCSVLGDNRYDAATCRDALADKSKEVYVNWRS